ncbi:MAG: hypothetical protein J1E64_08150 [Acetatifactor sp.]|nr:hypothetical protein [Acetatifactor sp.]
MKRKGLLKKIIGALCVVGVLISMSVTANAADKTDILGDWYGPSYPYKPVSFYEDGMAQDNINSRPYTIESGSLTVTYRGTGETVKVDYDLWRGEKIKDVSVDEDANAVIYKIIEPGKMQAWNVVKQKGVDHWSSYSPVTLTKVTEDQESEDDEEEESEAWEPTTPDEIKRYAAYSDEKVDFTTDAKNSYPVSIQNSVQGPLCFDSFEAVLGDYVIGRTYNILPSDQFTYQMDSKARITLSIPMAFQKTNRNFKMICVTEKGRPIVLKDLDSDPNTITFETDTYYAFALIYKDTK